MMAFVAKYRSPMRRHGRHVEFDEGLRRSSLPMIDPLRGAATKELWPAISMAMETPPGHTHAHRGRSLCGRLLTLPARRSCQTPLGMIGPYDVIHPAGA